ncbi:hypothetical protein [Acidovorax sp. 1608163]|uniref:hypothetical protein n=1 Tax=Acidovorax sp. 1608163 TaxID=2478662 RepID=UPI001F098175|nr:hypothetical protein [Acidovorax sp. 1608163]
MNQHLMGRQIRLRQWGSVFLQRCRELLCGVHSHHCAASKACNRQQLFEQFSDLNMSHIAKLPKFVEDMNPITQFSLNKLKNNQIATNLAQALLGLDAKQVWDTELAYSHLKKCGEADTKRTAERRLNALGLLPQGLNDGDLRDEQGLPPNAWC